MFVGIGLSAGVGWGGEDAVSQLLAAPVLKTASVGFCLIPLEGADVPELAHQADLGLIPASALKAVTTATALQVLGKDYRFETRLLRDGDDLVVKGGGDPTLASTSPDAEFEAWTEALKRAGVEAIEGDLVMDAGRFEDRIVPNAWPWGDVGNYYGSGAWGLNFHLNSYALTFQPGEAGHPARLVRTDPTPPGVRFENRMLTGPEGSGDQGYVYGGPRAEVISMRGTVPEGELFTIRGSLPNPPLMCGELFRDYLRKQGVPVAGKVRLGRGAGDEIYKQESPTLEKIVRGTNHRSVNLYADCLLKILDEEGRAEEALTLVRGHWEGQGVDLTGCVLHDGSGLSPRNIITPRQLALILKKARGHESGEVFEKSLPMAGRSGTMVSFGQGSVLEGRVRAKSGGMTGVRTYTGYLTRKSGARYSFALMVNNPVGNPKEVMVNFLKAVVLD